MQGLAPLGGVYQAGTFAGGPVVMRAGLATLRLLNNDFYRRLNQKCENFVKEMNSYFAQNNIAAHFSSYNSMLSLRFRREEVCNYTDAQAASGGPGQRYAGVFHHLLQTGIYFPPADLETAFVCGGHTRQDLEKLAKELKNHLK